jgi:hypothetical protein
MSYYKLLFLPFVLTMPQGAMNRPLGVYSTFIRHRRQRESVSAGALWQGLVELLPGGV